MTQLRLTFCQNCGGPIQRRLNKRRKYCGDKCRYEWFYLWRQKEQR